MTPRSITTFLRAGVGRRATSIAALLALCAASSAASAQPTESFGRAGRLTLGAERLFGLVSSTVSAEEMGTEVDLTTTSIDLGVRQGQSPWSTPRIALDGFAIDGLSLGAALGFSAVSYSGGASIGSANADLDVGSGWTLVLMPRVGYAYMFSESVGIWPRAGLSMFFSSAGLDEGAFGEQDIDGDGVPDLEVTTADLSIHGIALTAELPLVITPVEHFAILIAPSVDFGVSGSVSGGDADAGGEIEQDMQITDLGIHFGLLGWF
jgi:hypothetical protein